ncbi:MAG TPA: DNA repair and recombination protein RadA [Candidatus Nanoarchaeia archaeon]|nr:DNA repair and recombination protein RadA [Candidatus Nanoarchaeia archaeon]
MKKIVVMNGSLEETEVEEAEVVEIKPEGELKLVDLPGVGAATAEKLDGAGYGDLISIAVASPGELVEVAGMTEVTARKIIKAARDSLNMGFQTGEELLVKRQNIVKISSGCNAIDTLLGGGYETGAIYECFGEFGSGKTQIGHSLAVQQFKKNPEGITVYIDTENTFRPERIEQFAVGAGLDPTAALRSIRVARAFNSDHQMLLAEKVDELITKQNLKVKLVVVDSLTAHFRAEFVGRGTLAERQQKLNKHLHLLLRIADKHNLCVYVTNQVMSKPDQFFGDPTTAIGGHIVAHASTYRVYLRKGKKGSRVAKLVDSPSLPEQEVAFIVTQGSLLDFA